MKTDAFLIYEWRISAWGKRKRGREREREEERERERERERKRKSSSWWINKMCTYWNKSPCLHTQTAACLQAPPRTASPAPPPVSRESTRGRTAPVRGCGCTRDSAWYTASQREGNQKYITSMHWNITKDNVHLYLPYLLIDWFLVFYFLFLCFLSIYLSAQMLLFIHVSNIFWISNSLQRQVPGYWGYF